MYTVKSITLFLTSDAESVVIYFISGDLGDERKNHPPTRPPPNLLAQLEVLFVCQVIASHGVPQFPLCCFFHLPKEKRWWWWCMDNTK